MIGPITIASGLSGNLGADAKRSTGSSCEVDQSGRIARAPTVVTALTYTASRKTFSLDGQTQRVCDTQNVSVPPEAVRSRPESWTAGR
jgi:hypothetical protein